MLPSTFTFHGGHSGHSLSFHFPLLALCWPLPHTFHPLCDSQPRCHTLPHRCSGSDSFWVVPEPTRQLATEGLCLCLHSTEKVNSSLTEPRLQVISRQCRRQMWVWVQFRSQALLVSFLQHEVQRSLVGTHSSVLALGQLEDSLLVRVPCLLPGCSKILSDPAQVSSGWPQLL